MALIRRNGDLSPSLPAFFGDFLNHDPFNWKLSNFSTTGTTLPAVNICETGDNFAVEMAAPGLEKDDFKVELDGNTLTIGSERKDQQETTGKNYTRKEFSYQAFQRSFVLPKDVVDEDKIEARYNNGLLQLIIPKREEAKQKAPRMINIS